MIAIKSDAMKQMPEYCDDCVWYGLRPHPHKGWTELCELMGRCMDDDQEEEWIYDGNGRPKACPLIEVADTPQTDAEITELAKGIVHKMIDNSDIAEDAYPDLRQRMHEAVERLDEYYPSEDGRSE